MIRITRFAGIPHPRFVSRSRVLRPGTSCWIALALMMSCFGAMADVALGQTGACCPAPCGQDGCVIVTEQECNDMDGTYLGDGSTCDECPQPANIPDPGRCIVNPADAMSGLFACPDGPTPIVASVIEVFVRDNCDFPMQNAAVFIELTDANNLCGGAVLSGTADQNGRVELVLSAGGCSHEQSLSGVIKANGLTIRNYANAKSPDSDGNGVVELTDLIAFSNEFLDVDPSVCHDYDNDGNTGLSDLVLFSPAFLGRSHCP